MALAQRQAQPLPVKKKKYRVLTFDMHISEGDSLVLMTRENPTPVCIFHIEKLQLIPELRWSLNTKDGRFYEAKEGLIQVHSGCSLRIPVPIKVVRTNRGYRTVFEIKLNSKYKLFDTNFIKFSMPEVYGQLEL